MSSLDKLNAELDKILNPSTPDYVESPKVKPPTIDPAFYQIAAGLGNDAGAGTMSPVEKDLRTLTPNQLIAKYGQDQATAMLDQLAVANNDLYSKRNSERDWGQTIPDNLLGFGNALVGGLGSVAAYGVGKVDAEAGLGISSLVSDLNKFTYENQSAPLNARREVGALKDSLTGRDNAAIRQRNIDNGDSELVAGLKNIGQEFITSSVLDDPMLLQQGTADVLGSVASAMVTAGVIRGAAGLLVPTATSNAIKLSGAMDAALGKWTATRLASHAPKLVWPLTVGATESGSIYHQAAQDAAATLKAQGKTVGDKLELINDIGQEAADTMFLPAVGLGTISNVGNRARAGVTGVKNKAVQTITDLAREGFEETGQGLVGTVASNQAIANNIDPTRQWDKGGGEAAAHGLVYGSLAAGAMGSPGLAKQSVISAAKATLGYVDKLTALAAEKADDASPVGTKALKEKASTLVPNAEPVKQTLAAELSGTDLTPEEKDQGIKYANDLVDSLKVSVENEFDDTIPPELSAIISGSEHRIDAIQQLAKKVITTSDPNEKLLTAATMYQLLQPILDLQTNRPSSVDNLSPESQAVLKDYESLIANVNNSPTIKNAMKQIHDIMVAQGATVISPITEKDFVNSSGNNTDQKLLDRKKELELELINLELDYQQQLANAEEDDLVLALSTVFIEEELVKINSQLQGDSSTLSIEGKQKVNAIITAANIAPDQGNLDATESIMKHAKEGKLNLTPEQTTTLNASVALLRARKELEEKNKQFGLNAADIVSSEILTDHGVKDNNARSATQYTQEILSAMRRGNTLGATQLLYDMGLFVQHMKNKVEAINKHYQNGDPKASPVPYRALLAATRQWVDSSTNPQAIHKGGFVNTLDPGSIKFVQGVELEHKILADVYNSLTEVFPDLGIDRIEPLQLEKGISGAVRSTVPIKEPKQETKQTNEISSNARGLLAALTNPTELAKSKGNIEKSYPVNFNGKTYKDAEEAYQKLKHLATKDTGSNSTYSLMVDIIKAKLEQYPELVSGITKQGGSDWILSSTHQPTKKNTVWETGGKNWFIKALNEAYVSQIKPVVKTEEQPKVVEPKVEDKPTEKPVVNEPTAAEKQFKELQDKASKASLDILERGFKAVQEKITNGDTTALTKARLDVYGKEIAKRIAEMDEDTLLDKHAELQLIELGGNNSTGSRALFDIYDKEMVKRDKAEEKINKGKAPIETPTPKQTAPVVETKAEPKQLAKVLATQQSKANDVLTELLDSDSGRLPKELKLYLDKLLTQVVKVFPDTLIQFVEDTSEILKTFKVTNFKFGRTGVLDGVQFVFINKKDKSDTSDKYVTLVHEFVHVATAGHVEHNPQSTQNKTIHSLLQVVKTYVNSQPNNTSNGVIALTHILNMKDPIIQAEELLAYGLTQPDLISELKKIAYTWTAINGNRGTTTNELLEGKVPTNVYEALLATYGNILDIEVRNNENYQQQQSGTTSEGFPTGTEDTPESTEESETPIPTNDGKTGASSTETVTPPKAFELNDGQKKAFTKIMEFINDSRQTFSLVGPAGTGKTTIVNTIIAALRKAGSIYGEVTLTSPTHRANTVTRSKNSDETVVTLHKLLALSPDIDLDNLTAEDVKFAQRSMPEDRDPFPKQGLVIVDESSMMNKELYNFLMIKLAQYPKVKILFLGDLAQLRPIVKDTKDKDGNIVKAISTDSPALLDTKNQAILTEVMRAKNPELLDESVHVRNGTRFSNTNNMTESNGVAFTNNFTDFTNALVSMFKSKDFLNNRLLVRAVAYTNDRVKEINKKVRTALFGSESADYIPGDLIMGYKTYLDKTDEKNILIANGVDYLVLDVSEVRTEVQKGSNKYDMNLPDVSLLVQDLTVKDIYGVDGVSTVTVVLPSNTQETWTALGQIYDELSKLPRKNPHIKEEVADYYTRSVNRFVLPQDVTVPYLDRNGKPYLDKKGKPKIKSVAKRSIDYGYAHTIHKSQGGTYTYVFVDDTTIFGNDAQRLRYVGMTRAEKGAFILVNGKIKGEEPTHADFVESDERITQAELDSQFKEKVATKQEEPAVTPTPSQDTPDVTEGDKQAPETIEGMVKEYGYLGELLEDEDVDKVFKQEVEKILKLKADRASKGDPTYISFSDLLAFNGGIEYFTRLAKDDPNIIKLTKAAYKLRNLMRIVQHLSVLNNYHHGDRSINLKEYLNKYPELKSIFTEAKEQNTRNILMSVIGDIQEAKDVLSTEMDKLITLVGLLYIRAAFEKGQQYLVDTNHADLKEVLFPFTLGLLSNTHLGHLQKNRVVGDDSVDIRKLITPTELAFLDKVDGIPVGELPKEDFEVVKALVQNRMNGYFNQYEVLEYPRRPEKVYSDIVHNIIVEHLPKEGFALENFTPEEVIKGAVPESFIWNSTEQNTPVETKAEPVVAEEVPAKQEQPAIDITLDNELPTGNSTVEDNSPIVTGNKNAVIKVKPDVVAPSKLKKLVQGAANFFIQSFKFKGEETTRTNNVESPIKFVRKALLNSESFQEAAPNSNYEMNKNVSQAYSSYLGQYYNNLSKTLAKNLQDFLKVPNKKGVVRLNRINKGDPLHRYAEGKVLNLTEKVGDTYVYNQHLLELATLAGLQWFLTAGQTERRLEARDIAKLTGINETKLSSSMINAFLNTSDTGQLSQGLTNTIKSFWGVSGINTEMMAYTDGIAEAMAAEIIRAFVELKMITRTPIYIDKVTNEQLIPDPNYYLKLQELENDEETKKKIKTVIRFEVNRFDNDALYSFPTAIQEVVLIESEDVTYFGDDIPPVPQTQLGDPTIKLSRKEKKAIAAANKTEVKTNVLQANIIMSLSEDDLKVMFGGGIENEHMNKNTLASVQGKNKTILNAYQAMVDLLSKVNNVSKTLGIDDSQVVMRFPHTITAVGRLMMLGKYNIQSTKLLREVFLPTWSTLNLQNNQDHIDAFHLAVAQALGIKVHNEGPNSINKLRTLLSGSLAPAIKMVQEWMEATDNGENPVAFNGTKLAQIFKDAKEGLTPNAFHALVEYVRYQRIEDKTKFTTGLYLEADGVTNGPGNAIQMLTLGRFTGNWVTTVEKIGHSFAEPKAKHELDKNNKDLYGTAGINTIEPLQNILNNMNKSNDKEQIMNVLGSLYSLLSMNVKGISYNHDPLMENIDLEVDRNAFKNPLTILLYGSGITGIAGKAAKQMIDSIYKLYSDANVLMNSPAGKGLTEAQAMFPKSTNPQETYDKFQADLAAITSTTISYNYKEKQFTLDNVSNKVRSEEEKALNNFTFFGSEINAITQNITKGLVDAMYQGAVETVGGTVMQSTNMIQQATQIQSILLQAAFTKAIQDKIANRVATSKDTGYMNGDFISKQDFMDIMEELKVIAPYLKTPDQTFLAAKSGRYRNEKDEAIGYSLSLNSKYRTDPNVFIPTNAGVSSTPNLVIGMGDAYAILQAAIDESLVGNLWIYDGINMPLDKITDYAPKLNKAAFEAWQNNPLRVVEESFRSFMGAESMMIKALNETLNNTDLADQLNKSLRLYKTEDKLSSGNNDYALSIFDALLNDLKNNADSIDARHAAIARMPNSVDQLAAAGVPYHNGVTVDPTLDTPEKIAEQLNKYYQEELDKIKNKPKAEPVKKMTPEEMDPITKDMLSNTITDEISGVKILLHAAGLLNLGKSINLSREQRKAYIQLVRSNKLDGYKVVFGSIEQIKKYRELQGYKSVDLDQETDNGFIDMSSKVIHLINPSVETLVHEMIHAATYGSVLNYYQNPSLNTKEVNDAIERTEGLMREFLKLSPKELARLTPKEQAAIRNLKAAMQEPATNFDNSTAQIKAKALNEFMAWSLSNQQLISTFKRVQLPKYLQIAQEVIAIIKKFFTFKDKATGEIKEQDLTIPEDLFGNLLFNASIIINSAQPSLATTMAETTLFHSSNGATDHVTKLRETLIDKVAMMLDKTGQAFNVSLYNSGFGKVLTEAADTVNSLVPTFGLSAVERSTLHHVVAALSAEIQIDPLTIDGIQTLYAHAVVELAKQVDAGTYPKAKYDALIGRIGNHKNIRGKSTLLPVFLGLGLIDTELRDALAKIDMPTKTKNTTGTLDAGLDNFFNKMLDGLFKALTGQRKANNVADALELLTERLTEIALKESRAINSPFNAPGNNADKANEWVSNNISKLGNKGLALGAKLETSNKLRVKQLGSAVTLLSSLASETNGETVSRAAISIVNKTNAWKPFREFITDLTNRTESNALVYDLIKKVRAAVQQLRQNYRTEVPKKIAKKFTRVLSNKEWSNMFRSMAKTDLASLIDIMSKEEILDLFTNPNSLNKQISSLENRIQNQDKTNWPLYQAKMKQLANYMNTGITGSNLLRNPYAIHGLLNEAKPKNFQTMGVDAIHSIDQLTTLYAIQSLSQEDKSFMSDMVKEESEALGFIIDYLVGQSAGEVLKAANNPVIQLNYYKGHIPQINKSGSSLLVATDDQMHNLKLRGYTRVGDYAGSNLDPNRVDKGYYFSTVSGNTAVSQGTIQNVQKTISGVDDTYGFTVGSMVDRITDPAEVRRITVRLNKETNTIENLMPVFNGTGEVIAYERSMNPEMVAMLKPSEHLAEMIGVWRGRQIEEQMATEINKEVIDNHYTMWKNDIAKSPSSQKEYVNILDPKQLDVIEQDMVSLFSFETRQYIANTYGSEFWVRKDVMNDMIGFRKASIADVFTGKTRLSKQTQEIIKKVLVTAFGYEAYKYAVNSEKFIQNVTNEVRTLIIVKSIIVPMFNIASNIVQLIARGVPIKTIAKAPTKILELRSYTQSQVKQVGLEAELRAASGNPSQQKVLEAQIQAIKDGHKRLSIWPLIEAGEFSTISDIGSNSEDIDLFSGNSENWLRNKIDKLPPALKTTVRYGFMTRDTALFQGLQKMVQYGDFIAKAVMYDDLLIRKGLTKEQALGKITDEFVNYDKLPGRFRGYLEDMGVLWFWNYKLRITKVALSIMRENPINALMLSVMPIPIGSGTPMGDNFVTKLLDGSLTGSIGPGMSLQAAQLTPVYNILN